VSQLADLHDRIHAAQLMVVGLGQDLVVAGVHRVARRSPVRPALMSHLDSHARDWLQLTEQFRERISRAASAPRDVEPVTLRRVHPEHVHTITTA
jgi:hypothetical protein